MHRKDVIPTTITSASLPAKKRILTVCVKLFLEQGYKKTTVSEIVHKASVSNSIFQNIFRAKDGVLTELVEFMFSNQFAMARTTAGAQLPPVYVYAVETAIQMTLTEVDVYPPQKAPAAPAVSSRSLFACTWRRLSPEASPIKR